MGVAILNTLMKAYRLRVTWGKWGAEHIIVPGNACGLDVNTAGCFNLLKGMTLLPHNIDSWTQKQLLLIVFTEIAECVLMNNYLEL